MKSKIYHTESGNNAGLFQKDKIKTAFRQNKTAEEKILSPFKCE